MYQYPTGAPGTHCTTESMANRRQRRLWQAISPEMPASSKKNTQTRQINFTNVQNAL